MTLQAVKLDFYNKRFYWNSKTFRQKAFENTSYLIPVSKKAFGKYVVDDDILYLNIIFLYPWWCLTQFCFKLIKQR